MEERHYENFGENKDTCYDFTSSNDEKTENERDTVEGKYYEIFNDDKVSYYDFAPSNDEKTEGNYLDVIYAPDGKGFEYSYHIEDDILYLQCDFGEVEYNIYKNYIVPTKYSYEGEIPEGKTFDATCTYDDETIIFKKDGTVKNGEDSGTYKRNGDVISIKYDNIDKDLKYLIYKNRINNSAYKK